MGRCWDGLLGVELGDSQEQAPTKNKLMVVVVVVVVVVLLLNLDKALTCWCFCWGFNSWKKGSKESTVFSYYRSNDHQQEAHKYLQQLEMGWATRNIWNLFEIVIIHHPGTMKPCLGCSCSSVVRMPMNLFGSSSSGLQKKTCEHIHQLEDTRADKVSIIGVFAVVILTSHYNISFG